MTDRISFIEQAAALPQFCPECGSGPVSTEKPPPGHAVMYRVPVDWHLRPPCPECKRRDEIRMKAAGERWAMERERAILEALFNDR